jgi:iron complex outermembrane receptor protein
MRREGFISAVAAWLLYSHVAFGATETTSARDLADLSLEQLGNIVVSSVSGREGPLSRALGSVYVISGDDIRRAGATSIPEALRLAPNLQVARAGASGWAITARGFNGILAGRLLVLIDGRVIYTPTFSGVFWDAQDVLLEDVERIEVISGPGGVLWGANAFNGVINITTRDAKSTQGGLVSAGGGDSEQRISVRYGGAERYRVYLQGTHRDDSTRPDGTESEDGSERFQAGFRSDWTRGRDSWTLQGDGYLSENDQQPQEQELRGANFLARWNRDLGDGDGLQVLGYYDFTSRQQQRLDTANLEFVHTLRARGSHSVLWGGGLRRVRDRIDNTAALALIPDKKYLNSWNLYVQDEIALADRVQASLGLKLDRNSYTDVEYLPSVRIGWRPSDADLLWTAVSRAVRTPSRFDRDLFLPGTPPFLLVGGDFQSEVAYVYELGYRGQLMPRLSWSATGFYHQLEKQRSIAPGAEGAVVANDREGHTVGFETWGDYRVVDRWRLSAGYTYLATDLQVRSGAVDLQPEANIASDPDYWWTLRSRVDLGASWESDLLVRSYGAIDAIDVPSYTAVDATVGWNPSRRVGLLLLVRNVTDSAHIEWSPGAEWDRSWFLNARVTF